MKFITFGFNTYSIIKMFSFSFFLGGGSFGLARNFVFKGISPKRGRNLLSFGLFFGWSPLAAFFPVIHSPFSLAPLLGWRKTPEP